nr:uncharacterized protein LOC118876906 [Drosophila suzukii]
MIFAWQVALGSCLLWQMSKAQIVYKLIKVECEGNPARVTNISCRLKAINWNLAVANLDSYLTVTMINPHIRAQIFKKDYSNQFQPFLVDVSFGLCDVIAKKSYLPYAVMVWKLLKRYSNINHTCPYSGQLSVQNAYLETGLLPPFPLGFFQFRFTFSDSNSTNSEIVGNIKFYFQVMEPIKIA